MIISFYRDRKDGEKIKSCENSFKIINILFRFEVAPPNGTINLTINYATTIKRIKSDADNDRNPLLDMWDIIFYIVYVYFVYI